jgi:two-component system, OmpR family, heavy metal sensor histidine kinase CusS
MSSKNGHEVGIRVPKRRPWSLAARLTAWYAGSSFALIMATTGLLYWALDRGLERVADRQLADQLRVLQAVLREGPGDWDAVRREAEEEFENREHTKVYVRLQDDAGRSRFESQGMELLLPPPSFPQKAEGPGGGGDFRAADGRLFRGMTVLIDGTPGGHPTCVIQVALDRSQDIEMLAQYRNNLWLVLGAALVLCTVVGYQIARRGIRPIHAVTMTARAIHADNLGERMVTDGLPTELLALADTFNQMLDRLEQSFGRLSRFSADIAHELRTPVNNLRGEIEVALGKTRTSEEYQDVLGSNLEECGRLTRLIDSLLFLARAENPQTQVGKEDIDVVAEMATVCAYYEAAASEKGVRLVVVGTKGMYAAVNRPLFQRAIGNLVANAIFHTPSGGSVTLASCSDAGSVRVEVSDTGCGIPSEYLPDVFDRFFRGDPARTSSGGNVGLGLAIVKSIAELHGGSVAIASEVGRGAQVTLSFPGKMTES